jgi:predicted metal-dependent HD superfamily phosphohydrolase
LLQHSFIQLAEHYTRDSTLPNRLWIEIETSYAHKSRHYHTLTHLQHMLQLLATLKSEVADWNALLFALYYHDIVYNPLKQNNEEKSALLAEKRLQSLAVPAAQIAKCCQHILATKRHALNADADTNLFTDADLSILGQPREVYALYTQQIRKEYAIYPDIIYRPGRKKVVTHCLDMNRIFKTNILYDRLEETARKNLTWELESL